MTDAGREEGVALLLVVVILVTTMTTVYAFARASLLEVMSMRHRIELARARMLADSGVEIAKRAILDDLALPGDGVLRGLETELDSWALLGVAPIEVPGGGELRITVRDGGSRINLNGLIDGDGKRHAPAEGFLKALLERIVEGLPGRREEKPYDPAELAEAILDWVDADETTSLGEEESEFYARSGARGSPANRPLVAIEELGALPGVDPLLLQGLEAYFTVYPLIPQGGQIGINPNTAPAHVLSAIYAPPLDPRDRGRLADEEDVFRILRTRQEGRLFCGTLEVDPCVSIKEPLENLLGGSDPFPPFQLQSHVFVIESEGRFGEARARVSLTVDRHEPGDMKILAYERS